MAYSMSASADKGVSRAFTSVHLIGGIDINAGDTCAGTHVHRLPDLKTEGGAIFKGSVAVLGDMCIAGTVTGNVGGNLSGNLMGDISVEGDFDVGGNLTAMDGTIANLESDVVCINDELFVDMISPKTGNVIDLGNVLVDDITITGTITGGNISGNLSNINSLTLQTLTSNVINANTVCVNNEILVDTLNPKTGSTIDLGNVVVDDIIVNGMLSGNIVFDVGNITMLALESVTANIVEGNTVCVNTELQTNLITPKSGNVISVGAHVHPVGNVVYDLGSASNRWKNIYANEILISNIDGLSPITAKTDFIPSDDLQHDLGIATLRWKTICVGDIDNAGNLNGNIVTGNSAAFSQNIAANIVIGNVIISDNINGTGNGVVIEGVLALDSTLTANVMSANIGCFEEAQIGMLAPKNPGNDVLLSGNIIPQPGQTIVFGNSTNKVDQIYVNDIVVCGTLSGNVNVGVGNAIVTDNVTANLVCVNNEIQTDTINEKTFSAGVTVDGVLHQDSNVSASIVSSYITEASLMFDYKRTVVNTNTYAVLQTDDIIAVKATANGTVTLTLPLISSLVRKRKRYAIVDEAGHAGANAIIIATSGSDRIFAGTSWMLGGDFNAVQIYSDEVDNWFAL
jgi:hypothetical protein